MDYNLTPDELFAKVAVYLIRDNKNLNVLRHASNQPLTDTATSWVPNWSSNGTAYLLPTQFEPSKILDVASSSHVPEIQILSRILGAVPCSMEGTTTVDQSHVYSDTDVSAPETYTRNYSQQAHDTLNHNSSLLPYLRLQARRLDTIVSEIARHDGLYFNRSNMLMQQDLHNLLQSFN